MAPWPEAPMPGGILNNGGNITLDHVVLTNNVARGGDVAVLSTPGHNGSGGGIYSIGGALTIAGATIANNQVFGGQGGDHNGLQGAGRGGSGGGGGLYATGGSLDISNSRIANNQTTGGRGGDGSFSNSVSRNGGDGGTPQGGGLYVNGSSLTIATSTIGSNQETGGSGGLYGNDCLAQGGGLYNGGTLTVTGSTLSANTATNSGGGIYNSGTLTVSDSTLSGNAANGNGGGIYNYFSGTLAVSDSIMSGNSARGAGGGIYNFVGTLTVSDSTLSGNAANGTYGVGGGIYNGGTLTVTGSTLAGNTSTYYGGGIHNNGTLTVSDSTLSGNSAAADGGGIWNYGTHPVTLTNVTLTANRANTRGGTYHGGGLMVYSGLPVLHNTLIAGNFNDATGTTRDDVYGALNSGGDYNLIGDGTGMTGLSNGVNGNLVGSAGAPIDPLLGPLQDNGGPTLTHALLPDSPAIDAGNNAYATDWDQRGEGFPRIVNGIIDIGAFEYQGDGGSPGRTTPPGGEAFRLDVAALLSPAAPDRTSFFSLIPPLVPAKGAWPGPDGAVVDRLFASLNKGDGSFVLSQSMRQTPAEADWWALDPASGDGPLLAYARGNGD
jgi:hypothetical protein